MGKVSWPTLVLSAAIVSLAGCDELPGVGQPGLARRRLERSGGCARRVAWRADAAAGLLVALVLGAVYLATASGGPAQVNDTRAASVAAWSLGTQATPALPEGWPASRNYWGVEGRQGRVLVNRFPGVAYWAAPAYALDAVVNERDPPAHPFLVDARPARVAAAVTAAAVAAVLFVLLRGLASRPVALLATLVVGAGTSLWSVGADAMWPHAPAMVALAGMLLAWRRSHPALAAGGAAVAVLVRPHLLVVVAALAAYAAWRERGRDAGWLAAGGVVGLLALGGYSFWAFGTPLPVAGYDAGGHLRGLVVDAPWATARELALALGSPTRGVLVASPFLLPGVVALALVWRRVPGWALASAAAGLLYLVVQVRAVGHQGGEDFFAYRVSLEPVLLAAPALLVAVAEAGRRHRAWVAMVGVLAAVSIGVHGYGAILGGVSPETQARWAEITATVREHYGGYRLGEVDLRR